jgi:phosphate transport system permease protein
MVVTVAINAWPSFSSNGLSWFGSGGDVGSEFQAMQTGKPLPGHSILYFRAWPLLWGTMLTTVGAVVIALIVSTLAAVFLVEFAPARVRRVLEPIVRLLAGVPSVVYGLIGILAVAPAIEGLISNSRKKSVYYVVQLTGLNLTTATLILTVMIVPIMVAITANALAAVPASWREGSVALGVNRWRTIWRISLRAARPAIAAAIVLATARALGEAIMLAMVSGGVIFAPNPLDGLTFIFEPLRPLAATIVEDAESLNAPAISASVYAFALLLLFSSLVLSLAGFIAKQPMKKYGIRA